MVADGSIVEITFGCYPFCVQVTTSRSAVQDALALLQFVQPELAAAKTENLALQLRVGEHVTAYETEKLAKEMAEAAVSALKAQLEESHRTCRDEESRFVTASNEAQSEILAAEKARGDIVARHAERLRELQVELSNALQTQGTVCEEQKAALRLELEANLDAVTSELRDTRIALQQSEQTGQHLGEQVEQTRHSLDVARTHAGSLQSVCTQLQAELAAAHAEVAAAQATAQHVEIEWASRLREVEAKLEASTLAHADARADAERTSTQHATRVAELQVALQRLNENAQTAKAAHDSVQESKESALQSLRERLASMHQNHAAEVAMLEGQTAMLEGQLKRAAQSARDSMSALAESQESRAASDAAVADLQAELSAATAAAAQGESDLVRRLRDAEAKLEDAERSNMTRIAELEGEIRRLNEGVQIDKAAHDSVQESKESALQSLRERLASMHQNHDAEVAVLQEQVEHAAQSARDSMSVLREVESKLATSEVARAEAAMAKTQQATRIAELEGEIRRLSEDVRIAKAAHDSVQESKESALQSMNAQLKAMHEDHVAEVELLEMQLERAAQSARESASGLEQSKALYAASKGTVADLQTELAAACAALAEMSLCDEALQLQLAVFERREAALEVELRASLSSATAMGEELRDIRALLQQSESDSDNLCKEMDAMKLELDDTRAHGQSLRSVCTQLEAELAAAKATAQQVENEWALRLQQSHTRSHCRVTRSAALQV